MTPRFAKLHAVLPAVLPLVAALAAVPSAHAEANPYFVSVAESVNHFSNIFNTSDNIPKVSDTLYTTSLSAGIDQPFGRQRFFANGAVSLNRFAKRDALNNTGNVLRAGLDWSTVGRLSGNLLFSSSKALSEFNPGGIVALTKKNIETNREGLASFRLGVVTRLSLEASLGYQQASYTAEEYAPREFRQGREEFGVSYAFSGLLTARTGVSLGQTRYPKFQIDTDGNFIADTANRRDLYVGATWTPTGVSTVTGRLNFGKTSYDRALLRDFTGVTGSVNWDWHPSGKLSYVIVAARETGQDVNSGLLTGPNGSPTGPTFITDTNRVSNTLRLNAVYAATGKISATAGIGYSRRQLVDSSVTDPTAPSVSTRDNTTSLDLGVRWLPTRSVQVSCDVSHHQRSSASAADLGFSSNVYGCQASLTLN